MFGIQIRVYNPHTRNYEWLWVHPSGSQAAPYQFKTGNEAHQMKEMCYPRTTIEWVRVAKFDEAAS